MKKSILVLSVLVFAAFSANAQQMFNKGKLNVWGTTEIKRDNSEYGNGTYFAAARVGKQDGFERVTFEFTGSMPNYTINYVKEFNATGEEKVKVAGKSFIDIVFNPLPMDEEGVKNIKNFPQGKLKLKFLQQVNLYEYFEGDCNFALGLTGKRSFRVQELKNPSRVVIDFK
jgi:hypothetical protein